MFVVRRLPMAEKVLLNDLPMHTVEATDIQLSKYQD